MVHNELHLFAHADILGRAFDLSDECTGVLAQLVVWTELHEPQVVVEARHMVEIINCFNFD